MFGSSQNLGKRVNRWTLGVALAVAVLAPLSALAKPDAEQALAMLKEGNKRFSQGVPMRPHLTLERVREAASANQADFAYATILSCSDSRVPVEAIFDAGIMDLFVVRVAGNVCDTDEAGTIEYGVGHVKTPLLVVLGHTKCGAVTAVAKAVQGETHDLEANIPPLVENIEPAVQRAQEAHPDVKGDALIPPATEENVWQSIQDLFTRSVALRDAARAGAVRVVGAVYDLESGVVKWLPEDHVEKLLKSADTATASSSHEPAATEKTGKKAPAALAH